MKQVIRVQFSTISNVSFILSKPSSECIPHFIHMFNENSWSTIYILLYYYTYYLPQDKAVGIQEIPLYRVAHVNITTSPPFVLNYLFLSLKSC